MASHRCRVTRKLIVSQQKFHAFGWLHKEKNTSIYGIIWNNICLYNIQYIYIISATICLKFQFIICFFISFITSFIPKMGHIMSYEPVTSDTDLRHGVQGVRCWFSNCWMYSMKDSSERFQLVNLSLKESTHASRFVNWTIDVYLSYSLLIPSYSIQTGNSQLK